MSLNKNFWLFAVGRFVSQLGWAVQDVALPLYVLDKTHSGGGMMTAFILAEMIPALIVMPFAGGVVGDRYNRKKLMVWFDIARGGILLFSVLAFDLLGGLSQLIVVQVIMAVMGGVFRLGNECDVPRLGRA